jgi:flagellin
MTAMFLGIKMETKNANDGLAMLATIENATNDVTDMLQRVRELAVQAANDTNSSIDRGYLQNEVDSLLNEINRVSTQTVYNNLTVLDGSRSGSFQVGTEAGQTISFSIDSIDTDTLGLTSGVFTAASGDDPSSVIDVADLTATRISVADADTAASALADITAAIEQVASNRASYGAMSNRLEYTVSNLMNVAEFSAAARSRIEDADFAAESARLAKAQVLQQTGTAMLAQANASSQLAIQLIR